MAFYTGDKFPSGRAACSSAPSRQVASIRVSFNQPSQAERRELLLTAMDIRVRDVVQGPDGNLYVATEKVSGGNNPDGTILRIEPAE